jgi:hypothetical protein
MSAFQPGLKRGVYHALSPQNPAGSACDYVDIVVRVRAWMSRAITTPRAVQPARERIKILVLFSKRTAVVLLSET